MKNRLFLIIDEHHEKEFREINICDNKMEKWNYVDLGEEYKDSDYYWRKWDIIIVLDELCEVNKKSILENINENCLDDFLNKFENEEFENFIL